MVSLSRLLMLPSLVMVFVLASTNTMWAQTGGHGSEQTSGTSQGGSGQSTTPAGGLGGGVLSSVIPYITVSERYDSNVFFSSANKQQDYVTNTTVGARTNYRDDLVDATLGGGLISEVYVRNPGLNYIGANASLNAVLDDAVGKLVRGLGLSVSDYVRYTPKPQAWVTAEAPANSFTSGIQTYRNNTLTNNSTILSTYALNPSDQIRASYSYQMLRFFNTLVPNAGAVGGLYNSNVHTYSTRLDHHINPTDLIGISYQYQQMSFVLNTGGPVTEVTVNGAVATWRQSITREWTAEVSPGASIVSSIPGELQWTMLASLGWRDGLTTAAISYARSILPGFFLTGSAIINNSVALSLSRNLTSQWSVAAQSNYSVSESLGVVGGNLRFDSYGERVSMTYIFSPGLSASASGTYDHFTFGQAPSRSQVNRETVMLSLTAQWN